MLDSQVTEALAAAWRVRRRLGLAARSPTAPHPGPTLAIRLAPGDRGLAVRIRAH